MTGRRGEGREGERKERGRPSSHRLLGGTGIERDTVAVPAEAQSSRESASRDREITKEETTHSWMRDMRSVSCSCSSVR